MGNWTNAITLFFSLFMALWPSSCWVPSPLSAAPNDTSQHFTTDMFSHCKLMLNSEAESRGSFLEDFTFCSCVSAFTSWSSLGSILQYVFIHLVLKAQFFFLPTLFIYFFAWLICATCQIWAGSKETSRLNFTATNVFYSPLYLPIYCTSPSPSSLCAALIHCAPSFSSESFYHFSRGQQKKPVFFS